MAKEVFYGIINSEAQYFEYCNILEGLTSLKKPTHRQVEEIKLLTMLIEKYDDDKRPFEEPDALELIQILMENRKVSIQQLANLLSESEELVTDILERRKGLSKKHAKILAEHFCVQEDALTRPYLLDPSASTKQKNVRIISVAE